jgi:hypothetical protein
MVQALGARFAPPHVIAVGLLAAVLMFGMVAISAQRTSRPRLLQGTSSSEPLLSHTASPTAPTQTPGPAPAADALRGLDAAMESKGPEGGARLGENESATDDPRARGANANCGSGGCAAQNQSGTAPRRLKASPGVSFPDAPASGEPAAQHEISQRWPRERHEHPQPPEPLADGSEAERIPGLPPSKRGSVSTTPVLKKAHAPTDLKIPSAFR